MPNNKHKKPTPALSIASFCMRVLDGDDGWFSAIRIVDHYYVTLPESYKTGDRVLVSLWVLIAFKSRTFTPGELTGQHSLVLTLRSPKGKKKHGGTFVMDIPETATAFNYRVKLDLKIKTQGLWWVYVELDGKLHTKMPLRIVFLHPPS